MTVCLTNKIFIYLLAGNAMILTNTKAQSQFQNQNQVGLLCKVDDVEEFCSALTTYENDRSLLTVQRKKNWMLANEVLNWENESRKLLKIIKYSL